MPLSFFLVLGVSVLSSTANAQFLGYNDNFQNQLSTGTRIGVGVALVLGFLILAACFIRHCRARRARGLGGNNGGDGRMFSQWRTQGNNNGAEEGQSSYALQSHLPVIKNTWAAPPPIYSNDGQQNYNPEQYSNPSGSQTTVPPQAYVPPMNYGPPEGQPPKY